jgi:hypothetical protein
MRILAAILLSAATALTSLSAHPPEKNATGCWLSQNGGNPTYDGCGGGGDSCYICLHSDRYGIYHCYESPSGEIIYCSPGTA